MNTKWLAGVSLLSFRLFLSTSGAFPGWMGVYDHYLRHDGGNPGRFLIMMNESYVGLEANVGMRVNGGDWAEYPMTYVTDVDGNSLWEYVAPGPFPFGSTLEYYFHGYEDEDHIYDSRGASNYLSGPLQWNQPETLPVFSVYPGNFLPAAAYAVDGEFLAMATAFVGTSTNITFHRMFAGKSWESIALPGEASPVGEFTVAVHRRNVVVAYRLDQSLYARRSGDGGTSWGAPELLDHLPVGGSLAGLGAAAGPDGRIGIAYGVSTNCCGAQLVFSTVASTGSLWTTPSTAFQFHSIGSYANGIKLTGNPQGWFLAVREVFQGSSFVMHGGTSTNGTGWVTQRLGGDGNTWSEFDIAASTGKVMIASDPYYNSSTWTWQSAPGGLWTTQKIDRALESGSQIWLGHDGHRWFLYRYEDNDASESASTYLPSFRVSDDNGASWSYPRPITYAKPAENDFMTLNRVLSAGPVQRLVWTHNAYVNTFQRMYSVLLQDSTGYRESLAMTVDEAGQIHLDAANLTAGMSHDLQRAETPTSTVWSTVATWSHGATNIVLPPVGGTGCFRVQSSY